MEKGFGFHLPARIEFGAGLLGSVGDLARELTGGRKALVVTDPGVRAAGLSDKAVDSLGGRGFECLLFDRVRPNPRDVDCEAGGREAALFGAELIVAVGGGSVIDAAKAIALLQTNGGPLSRYEGRGKIDRPVTPLLAVPTTAGTGSEVTRSAVITDTTRQFKTSVKDVLLVPALALVDPEATYSLPPSLTASTGMDALVHAVEAYTSRPANPISDVFALAAIEKIFPALPVAVRDGGNREARDALMFGSLLAGLAFSHADVGAVHCMAEAVGGLYDLAHGVANSVFLPAVTAYNAAADPQRHAQVARACGLPVEGLAAEAAARLLAERLAVLAGEIGIPPFAALGPVNPADFPRLAEASALNGSSVNNCRPISRQDYLALFRECYAV